MAIVFDYESFSKKERSKIKRDYTIRPKKTRYNPFPKDINVYRRCTTEEYDEIYLPMGRYQTLMSSNSSSSTDSSTPCSSTDTSHLVQFPYQLEDYPSINCTFTFDLLTKETDPMGRGRDQDVLVASALERLYAFHSVFIAAFTGFGKTSTAIYMVCKLRLKTALLCHNDTLKGQWKEEFLKFTNNTIKVQIVTGKKKLDPNADVYIIGVMKASLMNADDLIDIGLVIIDEAHICSETAFTESLLRFRPLYLIGLSATPDRKDGLDGLLTFYFGKPCDFVVRTEVKKFSVFKYKTKWCPEPTYTFVRGEETLNWTKFITDLTLIEERWKMVANIAVSHPTNKIMILCDRQEMAKKIYTYLLDIGESAELLIGTKKGWDKSKRVLIAGVKKGGTALNDPSLDLLIIAADTQDVRQMEGRIRQTNNIVYVVIDDHPAFERHWTKQRTWFITRGADIYNVKSIKEAHHILKFGGEKDNGRRRKSESTEKRKNLTMDDIIQSHLN